MCPWDMIEVGAERCIAHSRAGATLTVQLMRDEHALHVVVLGDLGEAEVALLSECLNALAGHGARRFVVDLRQTTSISRSAWNALVRADFETGLAGDGIVLRGVDRRWRVRLAARRHAVRREPRLARAT
jgi:anti-anti-sigma regulatory factor